MTELSLAMIVRNEAEDLEDCLQSVQSEVNQIVVVDTGSTDATKDIARNFGAEIYDFEWKNDFAAARNEALKHVNGDWILQLDADHRLKNKVDKSLPEQLEIIDALGLMINEKTFLKNGNQQNLSRLLLFKNLRSIKYQGALHESPYDSLKQYARKNGIEPWLKKDDQIEIEHYSYADPEKKLKRNLAVLTKGLQNEPKNSQYRYNYLMTLRGLGRTEEYHKKLAEYIEEVFRDRGNYLYSEIGIIGLYLEDVVQKNKKIKPGYKNHIEELGDTIDWRDLRIALPLSKVMSQNGDYEQAINILKQNIKNGLVDLKVPVNKSQKKDIFIQLFKLYEQKDQTEHVAKLLARLDSYLQKTDITTKSILEYLAQKDMDLFEKVYQIMQVKTGG